MRGLGKYDEFTVGSDRRLLLGAETCIEFYIGRKDSLDDVGFEGLVAGGRTLETISLWYAL